MLRSLRHEIALPIAVADGRSVALRGRFRRALAAALTALATALAAALAAAYLAALAAAARGVPHAHRAVVRRAAEQRPHRCLGFG